jgi:hypothetical protein
MIDFIISSIFIVAMLMGSGFGLMLLYVIGCGIFYIMGLTKRDYFRSEDWRLQIKVLLISFFGLLVGLFFLGSGLYDPYK